MKIKKGIPLIVASMLLGVAVTSCGGNQGETTTTNPNTTTPIVTTTPTPTDPTTPAPVDPTTPTPADPTTPTPTVPSIPDGAVNLGFGEKGALPNDTFVYWNDQWWVGSSVTVHEAYFLDGAATFDYEYLANSATDWGFQVFYKNASLTAGKTYILRMKINTEDAVKVVVNGQTFNLVAGDNNIEVTYTEGAIINDQPLASIDMQIDKSSDMRNKIVVSNYAWEETLGQLKAPEGIVIADEPADGSKVIQFAAVDGATGYIVIYYDANTDQEVAREEVSKAGAKLTYELPDGTYKVKLIAKGDGVTAADSAVSSSFAYLMVGEPEEVDPTVKVDINFGEESNLPLNEYVYWNDQWWVGSSVTVHEAYTLNNEVVFDYEYMENSSTDWGFQVFYKNAALTMGKEYKLTLNINTEDAIIVKVNGQSFNLSAGDNAVEVTYNEGGAQSASLSMQVDKSADMRNVIKLTNVTWTATDGSGSGNQGGNTGGDTGDTGNKLSNVVGGVVNQAGDGSYIFACAPVENATGYHLQILNSANEVVAEQDITNGGVINCYNSLPSGTYSIQVKAVGNETYADSDYVVIKTDFVIAESSNPGEGEDEDPIIPTPGEGEAINIDATQTKIEGAGIMVYLLDKPEITVDDISISLVSFESTEYAGYKDQVMNAGAKFPEYNAATGRIYFQISNGFPNGCDVKIVINISYEYNGVTYSQDLTFVGNAYQSESIGDDVVEPEPEQPVDPSVKTTIEFGEENNLPNDTFVYWAADASWGLGGAATVNEAYLENGEAVFNFTHDAATSIDWAMQIFYKNSSLVVNKEYKLSLTINAEDAAKVIVNGNTYDLVSGDNAVEVIYTEGVGISSIDMQIAKCEDLTNTIKLSNITWEEYVNENPIPAPGEGEPINIDASKTKVEGAGIHIYFADKPNLNLSDINITIVSFESTQFAGYHDQIMAGATKVHYIQAEGWFFATIAAGFPNEGDQVMVVNVSYVLDGVTYSQSLTFVGNAYQA